VITVVVKMWQYFGFVGNLSILCWLASGVILGRYARHTRRTRGWWGALAVALFAFMLAKVNSDIVSNILPDQREELADAAERSEKERAGLNPHKSVVEDMQDSVKVLTEEELEKAEKEEKEAWDAYGGLDKEKAETNKYEAAARGLLTEDKTKKKDEKKKEDATVAKTGGEPAEGGEDKPPELPDEADESASEGDPYAYRKAGKVERAAGKKESAGDLGDATESEESKDAEYVKMLKPKELYRAQHIDQLNLFASRFVLWLAVCLVFADYMGRFNKTFDSYCPLPLSSRLVDSVCPKSLKILVRKSDPALVVEYLERGVRKGETFIYFGAEDPWRTTLGESGDWERPYVTGHRKIGSELRGDKSRAGTPLPRLRALALGTWSVRKLLCDSDRSFYGSTFAFEAAWFNRHCFVVKGDELASKWLGDLLRFLRLRHRALARSRQTVNVVLDAGTPVRRSMLRELLFLCEEANYKILVVMPDAEPGVAELFDEVHDELPEQELRQLDDLMQKLGAVRSGDKSLKELSKEWFIQGRAAAMRAGGAMARKAGETKEKLAAAQAALAERREQARREAAERAERERIEEEARLKAEEEERKRAEEEARRRAEVERLRAEQEAKERAEREAREAAERAEREATEAVESQQREIAEQAARQAAEAEARARAQEQAVADARQVAEPEAPRAPEPEAAPAAEAEPASEAEAEPAPEPEPAAPSAPEVPASFKFGCPACGQKLEAQAEWIGMEAACPGCGTAVIVPSPVEAEPAAPEPEPAAPSGEFKFLCPSCGQKLAAEPSWVGLELQCPSCSETLIVPSPIPEV